MISQASFVPFQVKEQLGVQAVIAGIHEFECDIITRTELGIAIGAPLAWQMAVERQAWMF